MFSNYDSWKTTPPDLDECDREPEGEDEPACPPTLPTGMSHEAFTNIPREPMPGTWAFTARQMARDFPDFDWDAWKDEMKESES